MSLLEKAEEISRMMKNSLIAISFGFLLVLGMPGTSFGGPASGTGDADSDGVEDEFDNCTTIPNPDQADATHNGCGDACSVVCDNTDDGGVLAKLLDQYGADCSASSDPANDPACKADCTGDYKVGGPDLVLLLEEYGGQNGPSGITNRLCNPVDCACTPAI